MTPPLVPAAAAVTSAPRHPARAVLAGLTAWLALSAAGPGAAQEPERLLFTGAVVVDGTGAPAFPGEVLVEGDRILAVAAEGVLSQHAEARRVDLQVDLEGRVLAPGFVDLHNHSTDGLWDDPLAPTQLAQGITTLVVGADGSSPWPIGRFLERVDSLRPALNVAAFVGHGTMRRAVLGEDFRRPASESEVEAMARLVERGFREGAFGLSSGLEYEVGMQATTDELIALARVAAAHGGFYASHLRDEEEGLLDAVDEAIRIGREAGLPVHISHIKAGNPSVWGKAPEVLARMGAARAEGLDVTADQYPYAAWQSELGIVVPSRRWEDPEEVAAGIAATGGGDRLQIADHEADPSLNGLRLSEIAERTGRTEVEAYMALMRAGGSRVIGHTMHEGDVEAFLASPWVMTASDGGIGGAHPRSAGAFPRVIARYVREKEVLTLERAVQRATFQPARRLGLTDRGVIRPGARADLVAFDPEIVEDRSTFEEPERLAVGVYGLWVAGRRVWADGAPTGARPGLALRPAPRPPAEVPARDGHAAPSRSEVPGCDLPPDTSGAHGVGFAGWPGLSDDRTLGADGQADAIFGVEPEGCKADGAFHRRRAQAQGPGRLHRGVRSRHDRGLQEGVDHPAHGPGRHRADQRAGLLHGGP